MADVVIAETEDKLKVLPHRQYQTTGVLSPSNVLPSPLDEFHRWFSEAVSGNQVNEPEAVSLSTATKDGIPSSRMVLFKQLDAKGFVFYTNYTSRKSRELEDNPYAAMVFYWREIHKSIRVQGKVEKVNKNESDAYFKSRPIGSQLGAWASKQSTVVGEDEVGDRLEKLKDKFGILQDGQGDVPPPEFWGGWRIVPEEMEFWQGKPSRLHDRVRYLRIPASSDETSPKWKISRLAP